MFKTPGHLAQPSRRAILAGLAGAAGMAATGLPPIRAVQAQEAESLYSRLVTKAAGRAGRAYEPPADTLPDSLRGLSYDEYRHIRFRKDMALWQGEAPFSVQLLHLGGYLRTPVRAYTVENGRETPFNYRPSLFDFSQADVDPSGFDALGFSGLRVHYPLNDPAVMDEVMVIQGASYFRALCAGAVYGLSARGVAVNTAHSEGEEFPAFVELYVVRPTPGAQSIVMYGLLDGPSLAGAYRFEVTPGTTTRTSVGARLFARRPVAQLGVGALTSMFDFGPADRVGVDDFRPRVHDSQGLCMRTQNGERLWRPLCNPGQVEMNVFSQANPVGFGLMQRVRQFDRYQDLETMYHRRPSAWVTPRGNWGEGEVILVEIPTPDETNDNIVAFWKPAVPFEPGLPLALDYDIDWTLDGPATEVAWILETRAGHYGVPGAPLDDGIRRRGRKWVIEFVEGPLRGLNSPDDVTVVASADAGRIDTRAHVINPQTGGLRVYLDTVAEGDAPINLRCHLERENTPVSETWTMQWRPPAVA
ncbi:glucan biosynthesis protein [Roseospira marina]|uniref:Glucan biosynthesis protein n=2 Tax=Roseospira marina TaxID=140057 RepID=A0A5M6IDL6_9PROT|nr:glucan biosynthesis protein [Roseospira marina]